MHVLCSRVGLDMLEGARCGRFDGDFVKVRSAMLHYACPNLSVIVHLGLRIAGVVCFLGDISQTFDAVVRHM
jgi:hypothetical protein